MVFDAARNVIAGMTTTAVFFPAAMQKAKEKWPKKRIAIQFGSIDVGGNGRVV